MHSCSDVECGIERVGRQFAVSDAVPNDFARRRLSPFDGVLPRFPVEHHIQLRNLSNPAPIDFAVKLDRQLQEYRLTPQ